MKQAEREQLQAVLDKFDRREDECYYKMDYMEEHKFNYEKQAIDLKRQAYHECFRELQGTLARMTVDDPKDFKRLMDCVFDTVAVLSRHAYFSNQMWRNLPGREKTDRAEVETAFMSRRLSGLDVYIAPCGCSWSAIVTKERCDEYQQEFDDIWQDYGKWWDTQR